MDAEKSENPLGEETAPTAAGGDRLTRAEVDQARADAEAGKLSEKEYAYLVDRFYTSELAQLRADIETPFIGGSGYMKTPSRMENAIMGIVAHMSEAPT
jgi:hypothetical protein